MSKKKRNKNKKQISQTARVPETHTQETSPSFTPEQLKKAQALLGFQLQSLVGMQKNQVTAVKSPTMLTSRKLKIVNIANEDITSNVERLQAKFPKLTPDEFARFYSEQFRQYNQELVARNLATSEHELLRLDTIDMCALGKNAKTKHDVPELNIPDEIAKDLNSYINDKSMGFYRTLPCFSEGVVRLNENRYIYFKIMNIDLENRKYQVLLRDYANVITGTELLWQPGVYGTATVRNEEDTDSYEIRAEESDCFLFYNIYQQISPKELGWNRLQKEAWREIALKNARSVRDKLKSAGTNNVVQLACLFLRYITISNFILEQNKPKIAPGQKEKQEHNKSISKKLKVSAKENKPENENQPDIPEKLIRNVGLIKIISTRSPKVFSSKSIKNYKIPSWTSRGHTRRYKSGKIVYVRPSVHHRKALKNPENKIPQSVINITGNKPNKQHE